MILNSHKSIDRFFKAKSVVFIGGKDIVVPIRELKRRGFKGKIFVVNPKRPKIDSYKCLRKVSDLPMSPDAAFIAVPAKEVISIVRELKAVKCKGIVCYSAGFKETGKIKTSEWKSGNNLWLIDIVSIRNTFVMMRWVYNHFRKQLKVNASINWLRTDDKIYRVGEKFKRDFH